MSSTLAAGLLLWCIIKARNIFIFLVEKKSKNNDIYLQICVNGSCLCFIHKKFSCVQSVSHI